MPAKLRPSDVFTPNRFPLGEHNVYVFRAHAERDLRQAISRGQVPVVYGEYGVGKTTLIKKFFQDADREGRLLHVLSPGGLNFADIAKIALERLGYRVHVSDQMSRSYALEGSTEAGFFGAVRARLAPSVQSAKTSVAELVVKSPTEHRLLQAMAEARVILAVDEMHRASGAFRSQLAEFIKASSNPSGTDTLRSSFWARPPMPKSLSSVTQASTVCCVRFVFRP